MASGIAEARATISALDDSHEFGLGQDCCHFVIRIDLTKRRRIADKRWSCQESAIYRNGVNPSAITVASPAGLTAPELGALCSRWWKAEGSAVPFCGRFGIVSNCVLNFEYRTTSDHARQNLLAAPFPTNPIHLPSAITLRVKCSWYRIRPYLTACWHSFQSW